jgi:HAAS domain-containing protein
MASNEHADDVSTYAAIVRAQLADLPPTERDALLEDLEQHLAEVAAEGEGSLVDRLGSPENYAVELRAAYTAGRQTSETRQNTQTAQTTQTNGEHLVRSLRAAAARVIESNWARQIRAFLPELRPAWWVLRAYLAVLILVAALSRGDSLGLIPNPTTKRGLAEILAMGVAIWISVRVARRNRPLPRPARVVGASLNALIALVGTAILANMATFPSPQMIGTASTEQPLYNAAFAAGPTTNIYPYSQDGKPLTNILLYDQDGQPITVQQSEAQTSYPTGADGKAITNAYPLTQRHLNGDPVVAPRVAFPPWPAATPSPSPSPSPTPNPSPTR